MLKKKSLPEIAKKMFNKSPNDDFEYYCITLIADEEGNLRWEAQTNWGGFEDDEYKVEIRQACIVNAKHLIETFRDILNEGCLVVENFKELKIFLLLGGHAIIEKEIAEKALSDILAPHPTINTGLYGFHSLKNISKKVFNRAPTKKQRMRILKRDNYSCKICGRSPKNNVDITLHVHHIRPWANRGLTHNKNLITLCHTCHKGLDPHFDLSLFGLLSETEVTGNSKKHIEAVKQYRKESFKRTSKVQDT